MARPDSPPGAGERLQQAWRLFQAGQAGPALAAAQEVARAAPGFPDAWFTLSHFLMRLGNRQGALETIERANRLARTPPPAWRLHELLCLAACGVRDRGIALGKTLVGAPVDDTGYFATLAQVLFDLQQFDAAHAAQRRAAELAPDSAPVHLGLASIELALGDLDAARAACDRCLELDPGNAEALHFRSGLGRRTPDDNNVAELEKALADPPRAPRAHARLLYALGRELEDLGEYEASFDALARGAALYRGTLRFDLDEELAFLDAIPATWTRERVVGAGGAPPAEGPAPIFVVGLPRTGTTLVERILTAHSEVTSAGELPDFSRRLSEMIEALPRAAGSSRDGMVAASAGLDMEELGRRYLEQAIPLAAGSPRFTDKFPQNALYLGLIRRALPNAKLVLVWRHPMDTCFSMYKQIFTDIYQFSYDLDELGRYYVAYQRLMRYWVDVLGDQLHVVHYEDLVGDTEREARRLVEFCGLGWEPGCLEFHLNPAPTSTASASQVRQRVYRSSVERWRRHEKALRPLEERLRAAGCLDSWRL